MKAADRETVLCPFHKESTPSCCVNHKHKTFHCFGCGLYGYIRPDGKFVPEGDDE